MKNSWYIVLFILLAACTSKTGSPVRQSKTDWPIFRGDATLSGYTEIPLPDRPTLLWTYKSGTTTDSSPVVSHGVTYWSNKRGCIMGVNLDGELIFRYDLQTAVNASPMIVESTLYIGRIDGIMTAISLEKKDTIWNFETMGQLSASPNCMDFEGRQAIIFGSYDNYLYCVNAKDGSLINSFESGYYLNGAVALWDNHVIFGGCDAWLRIINCQTGMATDSLLLEGYIPASPAIMGNHCYVGDYSGNIYELILEKGKISQHKKIITPSDDNGSFVSVPAISPKTVYFLSDDRHLYAIDRKEGVENWKYMLKGNVGESSPVVCRDKVIVCTRTGIITILDARNGQPEWEYDTGEQIVGSPAVIKDYFMILTAKGTLFCFGNQ
jgi:outer membrane protein assembly factor BamB